MRTIIVTALIGLIASLLSSSPAQSESSSNAIGLINPKMKGWTRTATGKSPWRVTTSDTLIAEPATDSLTYENAFGDGTLHLDWRFTSPADAKKPHQASISVMGTQDGQDCKISLGASCGLVTANVNASSDRIKAFEIKGTEAKLKPSGEWNRISVKQSGKTVTVTINEVLVNSFTNAPTGGGLFALLAEGHAIEFRNITWKPAN